MKPDMSMTQRHGYAVYNKERTIILAWCMTSHDALKLCNDRTRIQNVQNGAFFAN